MQTQLFCETIQKVCSELYFTQRDAEKQKTAQEKDRNVVGGGEISFGERLSRYTFIQLI